MKSRLLLKISVSYIVVILVALAMVGFLQLSSIQHYLMSSKERELVVRSQDLADMVKPMLLSGADPRPVIASVNRADRILGTEVWIIDKNGKVLIAAADHMYCEGNRLETADLNRLKAGHTTISHGQSQYFKESVIRTVTPMLKGKSFLGAVILYAPVTGVNQAFDQLKSRHLAVTLAGVGISLLFGMLVSSYITRPLREVIGAAANLAKGDFAQKVAFQSDDELGRLTGTFNYLAERLAEYEAMRTTFVANVSHELRSPLTAIQGFVTALLEGKTKDAQTTDRYLQIISKETQRLNNLVAELLELSKFDAKMVNLNIDPFPIESVIRRALSTLRTRVATKGLVIELKLPQLPPALADEDRIEQVLHNLLDNAIRYSPQGGTIVIAAEAQARELVVTVSDYGSGIPKADLERVWERFYRVDKARSREQGGTGLGLAIVQEIVHQHGGWVELQSEVGKGTSVSFSLPLAV